MSQNKNKNKWQSGNVIKIMPSFASGFSLLELLIVIAIVAVIMAVGAGSYRNFSKTVELSTVTQEIGADLRQMQSKAMIGEEGYKWGVHFVNGTPDDYYLLFSTSASSYATDGTSTTTATTTLSNNISFSDPALGLTKDIIFSKISGTTTASTIVVTSEGTSATTTISAIGTIY